MESMENDYYPSSLNWENVREGTAVPPENYHWGNDNSLFAYGSADLVDENGNSLFQPYGYDYSAYNDLEGYHQPSFRNSSETSSISENIASTRPVERLSSTCPTYSSVILILLLATGMAANILGIAGVIKHRTRFRHYSSFLHVMAANIGIIISLIFTAAARLDGWTFGNGFYKVVCLVFNTSQSACAFHLTHLVFIRCKEVVWGKAIPKGRLYELQVISFLIILAAVASAWPSAIFGDAYSDVIKNKNTQRSYGGRLYISTYIFVQFAFPFILCVVSIAVAIFEKRKRDTLMIMTPFKIVRDLKEAVALSAVFFACWLPYKAWRLQTLKETMVLGCSVAADAVFCIAISYSTISPLAHYALTPRRNMEERPVYTVDTDSQEEKRLSVESV